MGRNDFSKLVIIQIFTFLITININLAQEKGQQRESQLPPAYTLKANFRTQVYYNYVLNDTTKVKRIYADSSIKEFQRIISYYLTIMQPDPPKDGFSKVEISIDSIYYKFIEGENVYHFSNIETANPSVFKFEDFQTYSVPMSMQFELTYSPYGEIAKIEGDRLAEKKNYIELLKNSIPDSIWYYNWTDGLSDIRLKHIGDVIKLIYPITPIYRDSIWYSPIELQIDGIHIIDTVELKVTGFWNNKYNIVGKFIKPETIWKKTKFYAIPNLSLPYKLTSASGNLEQTLSAAGLAQELKIHLHFKLQVGAPIIFEENITKNLYWNMVNSFRFK